MKTKTSSTAVQSTPLKVLIADDSWVFRRILRDVFKRMLHIQVLEDASNGIEALQLIIKFKPHVLLLDLEMPILDGLTTLQHLMIHTPTPTIIFSTLSQEGTARAFDALKYGAVDFIAKSTFFKGSDMAADRELLIKKVRQAASMSVHSIDPMQTKQNCDTACISQQVIFCEECGARNMVDTASEGMRCVQCGDELHINIQDRFRRLSHVVMIGGAEGAVINLLHIIPALCPEMRATIIIVLREDPDIVTSFVEYLGAISAIKVVRGQDGLTLEGGACYIFSGAEYVIFSPYSGHYVLRVANDPTSSKRGPIDTALESIAPLLKERVLGVLLSGDDNDGVKGMEVISKCGGALLSLELSRCLCKEMNEKLIRRLPDISIVDEQGVIDLIRRLDQQNKTKVVMA